MRSLQTLVQARQTAVCLAMQFVLCTVVTGTTFTLLCFWWEVSRVDYSAALVWCCAFGPLLGSEMEGDRPLRRCPSVLDMGQNGSSEVRRRNRALSSPTDSEDSFDSRHAQHHRQRCAILRTASSGFSLPMATCTQSSSESRRQV